MGVRHVQAREQGRLQATPGSRKKAWNPFSPSALREQGPVNALILKFYLPDCQNILVVLKPFSLWYLVT